MNARRWTGRPVACLAVLLALSPLVLDSACAKPPSVPFDLSIPMAIGQQLASQGGWVEIGAFATLPGQTTAVCPTAGELAGGVPLQGPTERIVFSASAPPPAFGDLPKSSYAFAAVARAHDCSVIAQGCATVDLASTTGVSIQLAAIAKPAGACEPGNICSDAVCVAQADAGVGSGCSLSFVGGGPLADRLAMSGDTTGLSAPAIVATNTGFLLAYRETSVTDGTTRIVLIPVDIDGAAAAAKFISFGTLCPPDPVHDAVGLAWNGTQGAVAVACSGANMTNAGVELYPVDPTGAFVMGEDGATSLTMGPVRLSQAHSLAYTRNGLLLASVDQTGAPSVTLAEVITGNGVSALQLGPPSDIFPFGSVGGALGAFVTGTNLGTGLLSLGTPRPPSPEGGADGGSKEGGAKDAGHDSGMRDAGFDSGVDPDPDSGVEAFSTASFTSLPSGGDLAKLPASDNFEASWLSLSSVDSRIVVVTNGSASANPIVWYAYDVGSLTPTHVDSIAPKIPGDVLFTDVSLYGDNAFFVAEVGGQNGAYGLALMAFTKASTYLQPLAENDFANDPRIPIANVQDGLVAVAANSTRVAVVWGTARTVLSTDTLGGYAIFSCAP